MGKGSVDKEGRVVVVGRKPSMGDDLPIGFFPNKGRGLLGGGLCRVNGNRPSVVDFGIDGEEPIGK